MFLGRSHLDNSKLEETRIGNYSDQTPTAPNFRTDVANAFDGWKVSAAPARPVACRDLFVANYSWRNAYSSEQFHGGVLKLACMTLQF